MVSQALKRALLGMSLACAWLLAAGVRAQPDAPVRILLSVGQDIGAPDDEPLRYAERDAERVAQVLTSLGEVTPDRAYVLTGASADRVRQVIAEIRGRSIELKNVVLVTYVSSHADDSALHLGASRLPLQELRELLASVHARLRLLVVDACTSGTLIRYKGGKPVVPFAIDLERSTPVEGQVVITSAGPSEPAQEWEALGGSLFTHHFLSALRGAADRNGDGRVTLFEAYSYTYDRTLAASTAASAGMQHALHEFELRGAGDFVLTRPAQRTSGIELERKLAGHYVVSVAMGGELVAELDKAAGQPLRLALDAGRYLVRKPEGSFVRVGEVGVLPGQVTHVTDAQLERVPYMEVARRGSGPIPTWSLEVRAGVVTSTVAGKGTGPRVGLGLSRERGPYAYSAALEAGGQDFGARQLEVRQRDVWAAVELRRRWALAWVLPFVGARAALGWLHQALEYANEDTLYTAATADLRAQTGLAGEMFLLAGVELPARRLMVRPQLGVGAFVSRTAAGLHVLPAALGRIDLGLRF
jgi:hypothetical protein